MAADPKEAVAGPRAGWRPRLGDREQAPTWRRPQHRRRGAVYRRVAVCLAPGGASAKAVHVACTLIAERHAHLTAIAAIEVPRELPLDMPDQNANSAAREAVHTAQAIAASYGIPVEGVVLHAHDAGEAIVAEVSQRECELVVLAAELPRVKRHVRPGGETTYHILKHALCRVMLIGLSADQAGDGGGGDGEPFFPSSRIGEYWPTGEFIDRG
jgi:nucleotide-binding universal stress UspA family protein